MEGDDGQRPSGQDRRRKEEGGGCVRSGKWWLAQFRGSALALALLLLLVARPPIMKLHARSTDRPTQLLPPPFHAALTLLILVDAVSRFLVLLADLLKVRLLVKLIALTLEYEFRWQGHAWSLSTWHRHFTSQDPVEPWENKM